MDLAIIFVPFVVIFGLYCTADPLSRKFMEDLTGDDRDA